MLPTLREEAIRSLAPLSPTHSEHNHRCIYDAISNIPSELDRRQKVELDGTQEAEMEPDSIQEVEVEVDGGPEVNGG